MKRGALAAAAGAAIIGLGGCSVVEDAASDVAGSAVCAAVGRLQMELTTMQQNAGQGAAAADLSQDAGSTASALDALAVAAEGLDPAVAAQIRTAADSFDDALAGIAAGADAATTGQTYAQAAAELSSALAGAALPDGC